MGKKILVVVAFLFALVAVVSPRSPYLSAGQTAAADYETCQRVCDDNYNRCMLDCSTWQSKQDECRGKCASDRQRCNCQ